VTALRSHHKIPVYCPAEQGSRTVGSIRARPQRICRSVPRRCAWPPSGAKSTCYTPCRMGLGSSAAQSSTAPRRKRWSIAPGAAGPHPDQQDLFSSMA
jgi:hypothetical protein